MAGTILVQIQGTVINGTHRETFAPNSLTVTQANQGAYAPVQVVGTAEETIDDGDVGTLGWMFLQNLDTTNYVTVGPDSTGMVPFLRLKAGESAALRLEPGITIKAQANTAPVKLKVLILED